MRVRERSKTVPIHNGSKYERKFEQKQANQMLCI